MPFFRGCVCCNSAISTYKLTCAVCRQMMDDLDQTYFAPDGLVYLIADAYSHSKFSLTTDVYALFRKATLISKKLKEYFYFHKKERDRDRIYENISAWLAIPDMVAAYVNAVK